MSTAIAKRNEGAIVNFDPSLMKAALGKLKRMTQHDRVTYLKMDKTGEWSYGVDADVVDPAEEFLVRPDSFVVGYVAWGIGKNEGQKMGEVMAPIHVDTPDPGPEPAGSDGWQPQFGVTLVPVNGGAALSFFSSSGGGRDLINDLTTEVMKRADGDCVPVVTLDSTFYISKKYGKVFKPLMPVARWAKVRELETVLAAGVPEAPKGKPAATPKGKPVAPAKKAPAKKAPQRR